MTLPTITALPTPPSRTDSPAVFNTNADAFLGAFPQLQSEINAFGAAIPALVTGTDYSATSTTSLTVGTGTQSLTIGTGKNFQIGQQVRIAYTTAPANFMDGQITAYNSGTGALVVEVAAVGGSGTQALWTISLSPGAGSYATLAGSETLTNKTLTTPVLSGSASGTAAGRLGYSGGALSYGDGSAQRTVANLAQAQTFTNKTIALGSNTVSGTAAQFNTACTDAAFAFQSDIANFQPLDPDLTALAALATAAFGRSLLTQASIADTLATLGFSLTTNANGSCLAFTIGTTALKIQWGTVALTSGSPGVTGSIVFPVAFATAVDTIVGNGDGPANGSWGGFSVWFTTVLTTGATCNADAGNAAQNFAGGKNVRWLAIGH